ncbi:hypothetical protein [Paraflavitalea sp. CAU 1676]|uniref:hypothetical protein n=1 Tax=Paraflavitalea sp. CAU 1676 TaxID=3032598 RepID=UPI0023D9AF3D|nr:hypothetical protein [Paraflavitalea sp. CAU 1676]MDF2193748.1 hypothetical protein [Paraflavitalea sp. CAU 1676]
MKRLEYAYFQIYHYYHQRNQALTTMAPRMQTMYVASVSMGGWVLLAQALVLRFVRNAWFSSQEVAMAFAMGVFLGTTMLFHRIFIVNSYDEKIYNKFETAWNNHPNKQKAFAGAILVAAAPYLLMFLLRTFFPVQH